ncbi:hypothetical protein NECAME_07835 [Necator americanus]|uniref:Uncharacterized protein n=1 Tax=Necator americanus TaxID=51031 RepID=W2TM51_NECAM|nr:hypothetical protein NECAME_07835 [Necator americanus]ETN82724.1 hypothetical protein NECAME_07835 [Necator americanus]
MFQAKNATAQGTYGVQNDYDQGYESPPPPPPPSYDPYVGYQFIRPPLPPLVDRDVCDLDASVLLVVHSKRHGHRSHHHDHHGHHLNRAHRVRCSVIANYDEDSCNVCCQHAARRDKKLQNNQFVGFLAVTDDFEGHRPSEDHKQDEQDDEDENMRVKRSHDHYSNKVEPIRVAEEDFKPKKYYRNVKCVCCAPKRPLPPPPQPIYQQPVYPSNDQPNYQQATQPVYQAPVEAPPTYAAPQASPVQAPYPAQAPAATTYQAAPAQAPYPAQAPATAQPTYQAVPPQSPQPY